VESTAVRIEDLDTYTPEGPDRHWHRVSTFADVLKYLDDVAGKRFRYRGFGREEHDNLDDAEVLEALKASDLIDRRQIFVDDGSTEERAEDLGRCVAELIDEFRRIQKRMEAITSDDDCSDRVVSLCDTIHDAAEQFEAAAELLQS
jgi:hypothetical protein